MVASDDEEAGLDPAAKDPWAKDPRDDDQKPRDPWAEDDARWQETWNEDESAPPTTEGRLFAMRQDLRRLTRESLAATFVVAVVLFFLEASKGAGFSHTKGFVVGGTLATMNLWILASGYFAVVDGRAVTPRLLAATLGSWTLLIAVAVTVVFLAPGWSLGFGFGLAVPALGGIVHALRNND
jgi:hypothetical protein